MGTCASKSKVLRSATEAPSVVESREADVVERIVKEGDEAAEKAGDESRRRSLVHLLREDEGETWSAKNDGKASKEVKQEDGNDEGKIQENENVNSAESVADASAKDGNAGLEPITSEEKNERDVSPASQNVEEGETSQKITEEKPAKLETSVRVENQTTGKPDENKSAERSEPKSLDEKIAQYVKPASQNVESEASQKLKTTEGKPTKLETAGRVEDQKMRKPNENKPDEKSGLDKETGTPDTEKTEVQKPALGAEKKETEMTTAEKTALETTDTKKTEEQKPDSGVEEKKTEEAKKLEISEKKPDTPEKTVVEKPSPDAEKKTENRPAATTKIETLEKGIVEPPETQKPAGDKPGEKSETPKVGEEKTTK